MQFIKNVSAIFLALSLLASAPAFAAQTPDLDSILTFDESPKPQKKRSAVVGPDFKPGAQPEPRLPYHGNVKTFKFHNQFCDHYNCRTCTKIFKTRDAAINAGYAPCGKCGG